MQNAYVARFAREVTDVALGRHLWSGWSGWNGLDAIDVEADAQDFLYGAITGKEASEVGDGDDESQAVSFFETKVARKGHLRQLWCGLLTDLAILGTSFPLAQLLRW